MNNKALAHENKFLKPKGLKMIMTSTGPILIKIKNNKMTNIKKYLNSSYWYDETVKNLLGRIPKPVYGPEYPDTYGEIFGQVPLLNLRLIEKSLPVANRVKFEKYMVGMGFDIVVTGIMSYKFVHYGRAIIIAGDYHAPTVSDDNEDDDDNYFVGLTSSRGGDEQIYISILPAMENKTFIEKIMTDLSKKFLLNASTETDKFYMIAQNNRGLFTQKTKFKAIPIKEDRFDLFYGEKFPHEKLKAFIHEDTDNLMLLHGDPGTGKSNYIKHIITNSPKKIIYIPPSMLSVISSPDFVTFVMENKNSILLIEDAEEVLSVDRNSATNNLLGLTDGFLKDALNLKIICTFNCDVHKIDPALRRKGRMYFEYKFDSLTTDEAQKLADFMEIKRVIDKPMTLAEVFNAEDNCAEPQEEDRRIGFC